MKPSELVVSLYTAKELKKAGFPQDEICFIWNPIFKNVLFLKTRERFIVANPEDIGYLACPIEETYAAPTFSEIWELLPNEVAGHYKELYNDCIVYRLHRCTAWQADINADIQEAAAQMWLELKAEGLV